MWRHREEELKRKLRRALEIVFISIVIGILAAGVAVIWSRM
jgi:hypothetical protein